MTDSFMHNHQSALDSFMEDKAIQDLEDAGIYPAPDDDAILENLYEEAYDRSGYNYDPDENWAIDTYENGLVSENCHWAETTCEDGEEDDD